MKKIATHYRRAANSPWVYIGHFSSQTIANFLRSGTYADLKFIDGSSLLS